MTIDDAMLCRLEKLAALKISDDRRDEFKSQLGEIVKFVEILDELDLSQMEAVVSANDGTQPLRADEPKSDPSVIATIIKHAPNADGNCFVVPKIIE